MTVEPEQLRQQHRRKLLSWPARTVLAILALLVALLSYGLVREAITRGRISAQFPAPGRIVDIGTHTLHLNCQGTGSPTVLFEADLDTIGSSAWWEVQPAVAQQVRACSYDRAGLVWSGEGPRPRDGEHIAAELATMLEAAGEQPPYLLVGHATGGAYVRIFAGQQRADVCGMVLVDSVHPEQTARFAAAGIGTQLPPASMRPVVWFMSGLGRPRRSAGSRPRTMTAEAWEIQQAYMPPSSVAWFDETVAGEATLSQAGQVGDLGDLPLVVLSSARPALPGTLPEELVQPDEPEPQEIWLELQAELVGLSSEGEWRQLEDSGHYIQFDRPDAVIDAVSDVVERCRAGLPEGD